MTHLLERLRPRKKVFKADILSRFGETICLPVELELAAPQREKQMPVMVHERAWEEDPERWDGLS